MPSSIDLYVTADTANNPGSLSIDGNNYDEAMNQIIVHGAKLEIHWNLRLVGGQKGSFNQLKLDLTSGFQWTCQDPPDITIFHGYARDPAGIQIKIVDSNTTASKEIEWPYKLRAVVDGVPCETNPPSSTKPVPRDPSIKNR